MTVGYMPRPHMMSDLFAGLQRTGGRVTARDGDCRVSWGSPGCLHVSMVLKLSTVLRTSLVSPPGPRRDCHRCRPRRRPWSGRCRGWCCLAVSTSLALTWAGQAGSARRSRWGDRPASPRCPWSASRSGLAAPVPRSDALAAGDVRPGVVVRLLYHLSRHD